MMQHDYKISDEEQPAIQLNPIISYPKVAEVGKQYLLSIDVQLAENSPWPYQEEEFEISFILETAPFFSHESLKEEVPGIVLHRFGSTYGPAEYLLTTAQQPIASGQIKIAFLNAWGLPIAQLRLDCEVQQAVSETPKHTRIIPAKPVVKTLPSSVDSFNQRDLIEQQLTMVGWNIQVVDDAERDSIPLTITAHSETIAVRGYKGISDDYLLISGKEVVGFVKSYLTEKELPEKLANIEFRYLPEIPFVYHTTGYETIFRNDFDASYSRKIYTFHQPATLSAWIQTMIDNDSSLSLPNHLYLRKLEQESLFANQFTALQQIERSLTSANTHTLIQLETGKGKTHIAITSIYRLLTNTNAKHILYIVDIDPAKTYAFNALQLFILPNKTQQLTNVNFTDRYQVKIIDIEKLDPSVHVYIGTLEDLYNLYGKGQNGNHLPLPNNTIFSTGTSDTQKAYCSDLPIEYFDAIYLAESEFIYYQTWQPVLDYFDAFYIGIADTLSDEVLRFFNNNLVYQELDIAENKQEKENALNKLEADALLLKQKEISNTLTHIYTLLQQDSGIYGAADILIHLTRLLFLKYLDDYEFVQEALFAKTYTPIIEADYRWHNWVNRSPAFEGTVYTLLDFINQKLFPYLSRLHSEDYRDIRTIAGTLFQGRPYNSIRSNTIFSDIVHIIDTIDFNSFANLHAISLVYEARFGELLDATGATEEFYTPRPLVRFVLDCLQPQLNECILDPACGTAGFLVEAYKRLENQAQTPDERRNLQDNLVGIEKDPMPYSLGIMNMLLYGIEFPNLQKQDALATIGPWSLEDERVDIIATTPPFGGEEPYNTIDRYPYSVRTTNTLLIFLHYIMARLKRPDGRCGVVVSHKFLHGREASKEVRQRLLADFSLHTIVRLPSGIFSSSPSLPTNILFFEALEYRNYPLVSQGTQSIWYYEIPLPEGQSTFSKTSSIQDEHFQSCRLWWNNREENEHAWQVSIEQIIKDDYNLDYQNPHTQKT